MRDKDTNGPFSLLLWNWKTERRFVIGSAREEIQTHKAPLAASSLIYWLRYDGECPWRRYAARQIPECRAILGKHPAECLQVVVLDSGADFAHMDGNRHGAQARGFHRPGSDAKDNGNLPRMGEFGRLRASLRNRTRSHATVALATTLYSLLICIEISNNYEILP